MVLYRGDVPKYMMLYTINTLSNRIRLPERIIGSGSRRVVQIHKPKQKYIKITRYIKMTNAIRNFTTRAYIKHSLSRSLQRRPSATKTVTSTSPKVSRSSSLLFSARCLLPRWLRSSTARSFRASRIRLPNSLVLTRVRQSPIPLCPLIRPPDR